MKRDIRIARPLFIKRPKLLRDISAILKSGRLMNGPFTRKFEERFSRHCACRHAISVNSCTTALEIVLRYINISGKEVIVPTNTFVATANAVTFAGGKPVLADIKEGTYSLDPAEVERLMSKRTKAVIVVHIAGTISPGIENIRRLCARGGIPLVEDCAHAIGASFKGRPAGTFGLAGCFSFYPTKVMTTGTGGMIVTDDGELARYARSVRFHGAGGGLCDIVNIGNDWFMDEVHSAMGLNQLDNLSYFLSRRRAIADRYDDLLKTTVLIRKYAVPRSSESAFYKYPVQVIANIDVQKMRRGFQKRYGFELETIYWPLCHMQPIYRKIFGYGLGRFPVAESVLSRQVALPINAFMTLRDAEYAFKCVVSEIGAGLAAP